MSTLPAQAATINAEFLIRETLIMGFAEFASSRAQQDEVLDRIDMLRQGSQESWRADCAAALRDTFDPQSPNFLSNVCIGHPTQEATLPWIGIVLMAEAEDPAGSMLGDVLTRQYTTPATWHRIPMASESSGTRCCRPTTRRRFRSRCGRRCRS